LVASHINHKQVYAHTQRLCDLSAQLAPHSTLASIIAHTNTASAWLSLHKATLTASAN